MRKVQIVITIIIMPDTKYKNIPAHLFTPRKGHLKSTPLKSDNHFIVFQTSSLVSIALLLCHPSQKIQQNLPETCSMDMAILFCFLILWINLFSQSREERCRNCNPQGHWFVWVSVIILSHPFFASFSQNWTSFKTTFLCWILNVATPRT